MTRLKSIALGFTLLLLLSRPLDVSAASGPVKWYSYDQGVALGEQRGKKVLINFYADWCTWCKQMENVTFRDASVGAFINRHFVPVFVDHDKQPQVAARYNVQALPVIWFVGANGEKIAGIPGYMPPDRLLPLLKFISSDSYKKMSYDTFVKNNP